MDAAKKVKDKVLNPVAILVPIESPRSPNQFIWRWKIVGGNERRLNIFSCANLNGDSHNDFARSQECSKRRPVIAYSTYEIVKLESTL